MWFLLANPKAAAARKKKGMQNQLSNCGRDGGMQR